MSDSSWSNQIFDTDFDVPHPLSDSAEHLAAWLESGLDSLSSANNSVYVLGEVWRVYRADGRPGTAAWTKLLSSLHWIPTRAGDWLSPANLSDSLQDPLISARLLALVRGFTL